MVTKTSISAIKALLYLTRQPEKSVVSPRLIARDLKESPTYMAKVTRELVKSGILRAEKGVKGGVRLAKTPEEISLLSILEACQGSLVGDYCQPGCDPDTVCGYHRAALDLHAAMVSALSRWNLAQLRDKPRRPGKIAIPCVISGIR